MPASAPDRSTVTYLFSHRKTSSPPQNMPPPSPNGSKLSRASFFRCKIVDWHSLSWKNRAGKLSPARVLTTTLPNHHPMLGGRTSSEYISLTGTAKAYVPAEAPWVVVEGGGGTR